MTAAEQDRAAIARCATGDTEAFAALYERHVGACLAHAGRVLGDTGRAQDAVQEAFLDLWTQSGRFDGRRSSVRGWLLMLTHRRAVDVVRVERRRRVDVLEGRHEGDGDEVPPADLLAITSMLGDVATRALGSLSAPKREALVLAYWGGYTQREIAQMTGAPLGTVKSRMLAGMRELRPTLSRLGGAGR